MSKFPSLFDPWAKRDAWRRHPVFSNRAMFANLFPGFGIAVVAFSAYVLAGMFSGSGKEAIERSRTSTTRFTCRRCDGCPDFPRRDTLTADRGLPSVLVLNFRPLVAPWTQVVPCRKIASGNVAVITLELRSPLLSYSRTCVLS
ncbi:hypothetical protein BJV74DRAFT_463205 [Russula compacta]|nr:hypothetical protein BJV74DRAFT_463205 [Russula compacta]